MAGTSWYSLDLASLQRHGRDVDWVLFSLPMVLMVVGGISIYSIGHATAQSYWWQHWVTGCVGLGLMLLLSRLRYELLARFHWLTYGLMLASLVAVMFFGVTELGAERWIPVLGFHIQPSEFAKVGVIISLAALLSRHDIETPWDVLRVVWVLLPPWILIFLQPNLGTSLVLVAITVGMIYWAGASGGWILLALSPVVAAVLFHFLPLAWLGWSGFMGVVAWCSLAPWRGSSAIAAVVINLLSGQLGNWLWSLLHDYQKRRLLLFLDPGQDPTGGGYHLIQSQIAIGAGHIWGKGFLKGTQTQLNFIPEQHTDFIFSAIGEEFGYMGCVFVLLVFVGICGRLLVIAHTAKDNFGSLLAIGVFSFILFQTFINIGMNIGVAPVTGIPLPWLSYGRSALLANFMAIGLVESVAVLRHRRQYY
ncbi:MAG: rod shape-determining protein RodA [Oscillatoriales cyanobacterium SM2_2_1]|nr:rod shape-determining protein RodA [Oscillatoriales cyanobacterium SM2_2_1]